MQSQFTQNVNGEKDLTYVQGARREAILNKSLSETIQTFSIELDIQNYTKVRRAR